MKRALKVAAILVVLLLVVAVAIPFLVDVNQFRPLLEAKLTKALGREVKLGGVKLSIFSGSVEASDLSIADDPAFSKTPFLRASSLKAGVELMPLIMSRKLNVTGIIIEKPEIDLMQNAAGVWNFSSLGASGDAAPAAPAPASSSAPSDLKVDLIKITGGRFTMASRTGKSKPIQLENVDLQVKNFSAASSFPFSLSAAIPGNGEIKLDGKAGPINAGNAISTPFQANLHIKHLDLPVSGVLDPSAGITGLASIDGSAASDGRTVSLDGKLKGEQLKLVKRGKPAQKPVELDFAATHNLSKFSGTLKRADIHLGGAAAVLAGTYRVAGETPSVDLKLTGSNIPVTELAAFLPSLDVALPAGASIESGTAALNLTAEGPLDSLVIAGNVGLENTRLAKYDLASKLHVLQALAGIKAEPHTQIQTFSANVKESPNGTDVQDLKMVVPSIGELAGAGTISPSHALDFRMRVNVKASTVIPFTVGGTAEDPSFRPDMKGLATEQIKQLSRGDTSTIDAASGLIKGLLGSKKKQQ